ncbi:MAG TPA: hypothetical protein VMT73_08620 [Anaerolineales bacterium]|nr:hypothetical protein [Anaerolineales bacterium]
MNRKFLIQAWILFVILFLNFAAQIVYFFHLYYSPQHPFPELRSTLIMGFVFAFFLASFFLLIARHKSGFPLIFLYLSVEFLFYLWNIVTASFHPGLGWFFHLREQDPVLWIVFSIGYLSFFASGYFLVLLLIYRKSIVRSY